MYKSEKIQGEIKEWVACFGSVSSNHNITHNGERRKQIAMLILIFYIEWETLITDALSFTI